MKNLTKHLLYKGTDIGRQNVAWNIAGSFVYALASMVLSFLVIRVVGRRPGRYLFLRIFHSGTADVYCSYFGIRPFQITDGTGEYSFGDYLEHRNITCIMALGQGLCSSPSCTAWGRYTADKCMILILLVIYKVIDGYADVYESEFQRQEACILRENPTFSVLFFQSAYFW